MPRAWSFPGLFSQGSCGSSGGMAITGSVPFFPSWRTSALFWMKTASSVRVLGEGLGGAEPQPGWGPQEPERRAAGISSEGPGLLWQQSTAQVTWCCCEGRRGPVLLHCFAMIGVLYITVPVFCTKFKQWACGGQRPTHPASGTSSDQMSEASARRHERRGGSLEGRRQENALPLVPSGRLHQGHVSRRQTPEKAAMSGRGWSVSKIAREPAQSALGDPEGPLGGGGLSAGL